eukprot:4220867-Amphidinium_carterae.1
MFSEEGRQVMEGLRQCAPQAGPLRGRVVVATGSLLPEVRNRVGKGRAAWREYNTKALRGAQLGVRSLRLGFVSLVLSVLIVGFDSSRRLTSAEFKCLNKFYLSCAQSLAARVGAVRGTAWKIPEGTALAEVGGMSALDSETTVGKEFTMETGTDIGFGGASQRLSHACGYECSF